VFNEEFFILAARHLRYGVQEKNFPVFEQAIMVTLRSLVPAIWNNQMEEAWSWFYQFMADTMITRLSEMNEHKEIIEDSTKHILEMDAGQLGEDIYQGFFDLYPQASIYFSKNKRLVRQIVAKILEILLGVFQDSTTTVTNVRACGIRHIKYGIPQDYLFPFASYMVDCIGRSLEGYWQPIHTKAWISLCEFVANCMARAIQGGTTLVTRALVRDSVVDCSDAIDQAPRCERVGWMLEVQVSGSRVSPFYWALQDTKFKVVEFMLEEIIAIRADRAKYYCGKDDLFRIHPHLIRDLAEANATILFLLFDGLMWESSKVENNRRRVNYFFKDVWGNPNLDMFGDVYKTPLSTLVNMGESEIYSHPILITLIDRQWEDFGQYVFGKFQSVYLLMLVTFTLGNIVIDRHYDEAHGNYQTNDTFAFTCRLITAVIAFFVLVVWQIPRIIKEYKNNQVRTWSIDLSSLVKKSTTDGAANEKAKTTKKRGNDDDSQSEASNSSRSSGSDARSQKEGIFNNKKKKVKAGQRFADLLNISNTDVDAKKGSWTISIKIGMFFLEAFNCGRFMLNIDILCNLCFDQNWDVADTDMRIDARRITQAIAASLIWVLCLELWECSLELLQLRQRCQFVANHILCTLLTIILSLFTFACAMWVAEPKAGFGHRDFLYSDVGSAFTTLFSALPGLMSVRLRDYSPQMLIFYTLFAVYSFLVLLRLLFGWVIVICIKTHQAMHEFAQMRKSATLVELDSRRTMVDRRKTWAKLCFDDRIEFDEGDVGLTGGIQINRLITAKQMQHNRKIGDRVTRYATACGDRLPWPKAEVKADFIEEAMQRFESQADNFRRDFKLFQRLLIQSQSDTQDQLQSLSMSEHSGEDGQ
jgi:hemoglobin-like flavoprotein